MQEAVKANKSVKLSEFDRKVLLEYSSMLQESGPKDETKAAGKEDIHKV